jgi:hypothetical protein
MRTLIVLILAGIASVGERGLPTPSAVPQRPRAVAAATCNRPVPTTAAQFNTMLGRVQGWQAGDGGHTVMLDHGRRAWAFGDSLLSDNLLHHNALVIQTAGCAKNLVAGDQAVPASACGDDPATPAEEGYCWGGPMLFNAGMLYMFAARERHVPNCTGAWCFQGDGAVLAMWRVPQNGVPVWAGSVPLPDTDGINWTASATTTFDGSPVVYGYKDDGDPWTFGWDIYMALPTWSELLQGSENWPVLVDPVIGAVGGPETSFSTTRTAEGYVITSTADGGLGHVVTEWSGPSPLGPWTTRAIADYPDTDEHMWYLPLRVAGTNVHVISQNWPHRPLSDIPAFPADFRTVAF